MQAGIVLLSVAGWLNPEFWGKSNAFLQTGNLQHLAVAAVGTLFVGPAVILIAYFNDFLRGWTSRSRRVSADGFENLVSKLTFYF